MTKKVMITIIVVGTPPHTPGGNLPQRNHPRLTTGVAR